MNKLKSPIRISPRFKSEKIWINSFLNNVREEDLDNLTEEVMIALLGRECEIMRLKRKLKNALSQKGVQK